MTKEEFTKGMRNAVRQIALLLKQLPLKTEILQGDATILMSSTSTYTN